MNCLLSVELHNHTRHHETQCSRRGALRKEIQAQWFFRKATCWWQKLTVVKTESAPKVFSYFPGWVWQWHTLTFTGWEQCFCQQNSNVRFTPVLFPCSVPALKIHSWDKLNLSMKKVFELAVLCVLCGRKVNELWMLVFYEMSTKMEIQAHCFL